MTFEPCNSYLCTECNRAFNTVESLYQHKRAKHRKHTKAVKKAIARQRHVAKQRREQREHDFKSGMAQLPLHVRKELAEDLFDDLSDGAFFAACEDTFGIQSDDWITE